MSHTPGPWRVGYGDGSGKFEDGGGASITSFDSSKRDVVRGGNPEGDCPFGVLKPSDADLIAAAPELLAALREMVDNGGTTYGEWMPNATLRKARTAIAKAEGRS